MKSIFICYQKTERGEAFGYAIDEEGYCLAQHYCSSPLWVPHDMGVTSRWKHDIYGSHYPDGYELKWHGEGFPPHTRLKEETAAEIDPAASE